jgi:hypothetical protein
MFPGVSVWDIAFLITWKPDGVVAAFMSSLKVIVRVLPSEASNAPDAVGARVSGAGGEYSLVKGVTILTLFVAGTCPLAT